MIIWAAVPLLAAAVAAVAVEAVRNTAATHYRYFVNVIPLFARKTAAAAAAVQHQGYRHRIE